MNTKPKSASDIRMDTSQFEGAWITKIGESLFFLNFGKSRCEGIFELGVGTSIFLGAYEIDPTCQPATLDLKLTDGIGKNGDRLAGRTAANVVEAIVRLDGDTLEFYGPPPEIGGRPAAFPDAPPGLVGHNLYLSLQRAR